MYVANHLSSEKLRKLAKQQSQVRILLRLQAVILAKAEHTAPEIAEILSVTYRSVQYWIQRYNRQGLEGLRDLRRGGNQRKLTDQQEQQIKKYLDYQADDPTGGVRRGQDLRQWIHQQFGVLYSLPGIYDLLHRLGYRCLMPRPRHRKADPQRQRAFKKTF
jgi:transposase